MTPGETSRLAAHTEGILSQKGAGLDVSLADSRDHLEEEDLSRKQAMEKGNSWLNTALSVEGLGTPEERRKLIKTKILSKVFLEPSPGHPELRVKPPSRGIDSSAERAAEEESPSDGHLQELTHLSLQVSGPRKRSWRAARGVEGTKTSCSAQFCSLGCVCWSLGFAGSCPSQLPAIHSPCWQQKPWASSIGPGLTQDSHPQCLSQGRQGMALGPDFQHLIFAAAPGEGGREKRRAGLFLVSSVCARPLGWAAPAW